MNYVLAIGATSKKTTVVFPVVCESLKEAQECLESYYENTLRQLDKQVVVSMFGFEKQGKNWCLIETNDTQLTATIIF